MAKMPVTALIHFAAHADRCWKAEETNSTRLAARANLVLSGVTAIIGLKVFALGKEAEMVLSFGLDARAIFFWIATLGVFWFLWLALVTILDAPTIPAWLTRKRSEPPKPMCSNALSLDPIVMDNAEEVPEADAGWYLMRVTYNAAKSLQARNEARSADIGTAQGHFLRAAALVFVAFVLYTWMAYEHSRTQSRPQPDRPAERVDHLH